MSASEPEVKKQIHYDSEGFESTAEYKPSTKAEIKAGLDRQKYWLKIRENFPDYMRKHPNELEEHIRQHGIPPMFRGDAWQYLANSHATTCPERIASPKRYDQCRKSRSTLKTEIQIRKDITRTFPTHTNYRRKAPRRKKTNSEMKDASSEAAAVTASVEEEKKDILDAMELYLPIIQHGEIELTALDTKNQTDMNMLFSALHPQSLSHKTKIKRFIRQQLADPAARAVGAETKRIVDLYLPTIQEAEVILDEIDTTDEHEMQELYELCNILMLGHKTHLIKYVRFLQLSEEEQKALTAASTGTAGKKPKPTTAEIDSGVQSSQSVEEFLSSDSFGEGQMALFRVLMGYAVHNPGLGYTQGMGGVAGVFLMYMGEEDSFWLMHKTLSDPRYGHLSQLWIDGFPLLHRYQYMMHRFIKSLMPKLHAYLKNTAMQNLGADEGSAMSMMLMTFLPPWFNNMFSRFQPPIVMRMWDILLMEGPKILFRVALGMLRMHKKKLKRMPFEELAIFLTQTIYTEPIDVNAFYKMVHSDIGITKSQMNKYAEQYKKLALDGNGHVTY